MNCSEMPSQGQTISGENFLLLPGFHLEQPENSTADRLRLQIGRDSMVGSVFMFETDQGELTIGERCLLAGGVVICRTNIQIGNDVIWEGGDASYIYDHASHALDYRERCKDIDRQLEDYRQGRSFISSKDWSVVPARPIIIHDRVWISSNCIILKGVTIGEGARIMPGTVVTRNVEPYTIMTGNPACQMH